MNRPLLIGLVGVALIGPVRPAEAPTAFAAVPHSNTTSKASMGPQKAYKRYAWELVGYDKRQYRCLVRLWGKESGWRARAWNPVPVNGRHAGGIPQILGLNPNTHWVYQIERGVDYIRHRYGTPCGAWSFWQKQEAKHGTGWY